jgi:hypothetical protein
LVWDNKPILSDAEPARIQADPVQVDLAEFAALRAEILTFLNLQNAFLGVAVLIITAVINVAAGEKVRLWMVGCAPLPLAILAALYGDVAARIGRAGNYIGGTLGTRLDNQLPPRSLGWERFIRKEYQHRRLLWCTDKIRYFVFFVLALVSQIVSDPSSVPSPVLVLWLTRLKTVNWYALGLAFIAVCSLEYVAGKQIDAAGKSKFRKWWEKWATNRWASPRSSSE